MTWSDIRTLIRSNLAGGSSRLDFFLAEAEWMGCDSTLQAMSYAMEMVEELEERERRVSDEG
jgi:hypothetical protein